MNRIEVAVVVPTLDHRHDLYRRVRNAYYRTLEGVNFRFVTVRNSPSCGQAWQHGMDAVEDMEPLYIHLGADDLVPRDGWYQAGVEAVGWGAVPGAIIHRPDGSLESGAAWETPGEHMKPADLARVPFCSFVQWMHISPIPPIQYYSDNAFHDQAADNGWPCLTHKDYRFTHHKPRQSRPGEQEQMIADQRAYQQWRKLRWNAR